METGTEFTCVYLTSSRQEFEEAARLIEPAGVHLRHAALLDRAFALLRDTGAGVVVTDVRFRDGNWRHARELLCAFRPGTQVVVAVGDADEQFWNQRLLPERLADLVFKPFHAEELKRVLERAHQQAETTRVPLRLARTA